MVQCPLLALQAPGTHAQVCAGKPHTLELKKTRLISWCIHHARAPSGGDLCEVRAALHRPGPASSGTELPSHCYPSWNAPGGEVGWRRVCACPSIWVLSCGGGSVERRESQPSHLLSQRLSRYQQFKDFQRRILVATNLFGRGMDIERVNIAFNYDMPEDSDTYLHRVSCPPTPLPVCAEHPPSPLSSLGGLQSNPSPSRWPERAGLAPRAWPSHLCQMRMMPRS